MHAAHHSMAALLLGACITLGAYLWGAWREGARWRAGRTASFCLGMGLVIAALWPPFVAVAHHDLRLHMVQHLLLGMLGPVGIVLGAPMTLLFRRLDTRHARALSAILRSRPMHVLGHPVTALVLNLGAMAALYTTPLFAAMGSEPALHLVVHLHFLLAGCLFSWSIAGADPSPARPSHATRLAVLFVAMAGHTILAKAMFAYGLPRDTHHCLSDLEVAAQLMYYGGDLSELLLASALFASWHAKRARRWRRSPQPTSAQHMRPR